jgi:FlaA1/EpsC-like NDP-sugar epimerase
MAVAHGAAKFIYVSTDKAVNPVSIMGASKRAGEMVVQAMAEAGRTQFTAVRFGNVLGSRGSVIPTMKRQIARGGPVTVTHPDMTRYFMTIPEAVQLIIQAGAMGKHGEIFILDMGEPVKIVDLARDLIKLSGFVPDQDIPVIFTGIRPGEKIFEELLTADERNFTTTHEKIFVAPSQGVDPEWLRNRLDALIAHAHAGEAEHVRTALFALVNSPAHPVVDLIANGNGHGKSGNGVYSNGNGHGANSRSRTVPAMREARENGADSPKVAPDILTESGPRGVETTAAA